MQALASGASGQDAEIHFVPHSGPHARGIYATLHCTLRRPTDADDVRAALRGVYAGSPFVEVFDEPPRMHDIVGTNRCHLGVAVEGKTLAVFSTLDNLVKGAAGGGVQWMNRLFGLDVTIWSPPHLLGIAGAAVNTVGCLLIATEVYALDRGRRLLAVVLFGAMLYGTLHLVVDPSNEQSATAVLDKISGAALIAARQRQARVQLLAGVVEQLMIDTKRARDADAAAMNMQLVTWRDGRAANEAFVAGSGHALRTWRQP